jgi:hypothetical protein
MSDVLKGIRVLVVGDDDDARSLKFSRIEGSAVAATPSVQQALAAYTNRVGSCCYRHRDAEYNGYSDQ